MSARGLKLFLPGVGRSVKLNRDELDDALMAITPGKVFYVNANADIEGLEGGSDLGGDHDGLTWEGAFASINTAVGNCVDGRGDVIVALGGEGYDENVVIDKDFLTLIGVVAAGYARPDVTPASGKAIDVQAQGFVAMHMRFAAPAADTDLALHQGNGGKYIDVVFDGDAAQGNAKALLRLKGTLNDDSYTASENEFERCLFRGSGGYGVAFDVGNGAGNQVGCTDNKFRDCYFQSNDQEDIVAVDTSAGGAYSMKDNYFEHCMIGMGTSKNKATHVDNKTTHGVANTGNVWVGCYVNDDTTNTTALKTDTTTSSWIGCFDLDGVINGDALD